MLQFASMGREQSRGAVGSAVLEFCKAGFAYSHGADDATAHPVVADVSFDVQPGEVVLLVGASGCGKSTVLKMANGLIPHYVTGYQYGQVLLGDRSIAELSLYDVARLVGSVFQNPRTQMFNVQVRAELAFACENLGVDPARIEAAIAHVVREFHAESLLGRTVFELSGGEWQKVACMCASVLETKVVVLDEPSSNLDARAVAELAGIIRAWKAAGKAVLVAEHRLYYLRDLVDKVIHIEDGRVAHTWTGEEFRALDARATDLLGLRRLWPQECTPRPLLRQPCDARAHLEGFTCTYGKGKAARCCLEVDSLELPLGVPIALIGHNGAGKSTFMRTLCGLAKQATGTCELPGAANLNARARGLVKRATSDRTLSSAANLDARVRGLAKQAACGRTPSDASNSATGLRGLARQAGSGGALLACVADVDAKPRNLTGQAAGTCGLPVALKLDAKARLRNSYLVMQDVTSQLFCASVEEEVAMSACSHPEGRNSARGVASVADVLAELDLAPYAQAHPLALSGGQQQRVSVACARAAGRRIVLFDEPTSGLDARHMREVAALLGDVAAGTGPDSEERLVMVVTHDYEFICACCGYAVCMEEGRAVEAYSLGDEKGRARLRDFFWGGGAAGKPLLGQVT